MRSRIILDINKIVDESIFSKTKLALIKLYCENTYTINELKKAIVEDKLIIDYEKKSLTEFLTNIEQGTVKTEI